jgi:hypothetical protein
MNTNITGYCTTCKKDKAVLNMDIAVGCIRMTLACGHCKTIFINTTGSL